MSVRNLNNLFRPKSVAVIGASDKLGTVGSLAMRNLLQGSFSGPIMPVTNQSAAVAGVLAYKDIESLPVVPDLGVICSPPGTIAEQLRKLGELGTHAAVVLTACPPPFPGQRNMPCRDEMIAVARRYGMRLLGPNSLGLMVPAIGLNASFAHEPAHDGRIAFVSQSGTLCAAVLDWARPKGIGFSHFISLGDSVDVDFSDVLDYLGSDPSTRAILLYIESIHQRRDFMSSARAASRNKPVVAIKGGRAADTAHSNFLPKGSAVTTDAVYDAALSRAGMLRVYDLDEMFMAVETLSRARAPRGKTLGVLTNSGSIGVMAVDELIEVGGTLANLTPEVLGKLNTALPGQWSHANPLEIGADADGERYVKALDVLLESQEVDTALIMHAPTATTSSLDIAEHIIKTVTSHKANVMTCWVGQDQVGPARRRLREAGIPAYETPRAAVHAFMHLVNYRRNQEMLMETPASALTGFVPNITAAKAAIKKSLSEDCPFLSEHDAKAVLDAYGIPTVETYTARNPAEASRIALRLNEPVALKILSPTINRKAELGGVILNLQGPFEVEKAANGMLEHFSRTMPEARLQGFSIQAMARRPGAQEIFIGVTTDPIFGPVIVFGHGGSAAEIINDMAVALPPLNMSLARELIQRTRVAKLLQGYGNRQPANMDELCLTLMKISQLIIDIPQVSALDINPLFVDSAGVLVLDACIQVTLAPPQADRLAIRPYPRELEEIITLTNGRQVLVRPIRPEDEPNHHVFLSKLTPEDVRFRFFGRVGELPHSEMARLTQIDYDREMAFIATSIGDEPDETLGVVRTVTDPDNEVAEFAVVSRSDLKGTGLAKALMMKIIRYSRARGTGQIIGQVLTDNTRMLKFCESLGFKRLKYVDGDIVEVGLDLHAPLTETEKRQPGQVQKK